MRFHSLAARLPSSFISPSPELASLPLFFASHHPPSASSHHRLLSSNLALVSISSISLILEHPLLAKQQLTVAVDSVVVPDPLTTSHRLRSSRHGNRQPVRLFSSAEHPKCVWWNACLRPCKPMADRPRAHGSSSAASACRQPVRAALPLRTDAASL